ncbi:hypothetical protein [Pseudomonas boanensis]|uniref:hypothetical protein n=1 Tax=Metapseudomonas boanensis TaxID=2822138 RepID=UPI0035D4C0D9
MSLDISARQKLTESLLTDHPLAQAIAYLKRMKPFLSASNSIRAMDLSAEVSEFIAAYERNEQQSC